jgi:hypothetical protein
MKRSKERNQKGRNERKEGRQEGRTNWKEGKKEGNKEERRVGTKGLGIGKKK